MGHIILHSNDRISAQENPHVGGFRGEVIFGTGRHLVPFKDPYGNTSYRTAFDKVLFKAGNIVPIGGYQFAFDKMFNIAPDANSTLRVGDLNDESPQMKIGVPKSEYLSTKYTGECGNGVSVNAGVNISALNYIFGFMIGDGGCKEDNVTPIAPNYKNRLLYHAVPFRMSNDGHDVDTTAYFGKSTTAAGATGVDPITSYYIKKFDDPAPRIVHCWASDDSDSLETVDDSVFSSTSSIAIESYVEMNLSVSQYDTRGYFSTAGSTARVNEFALVSGWYNSVQNDWESCRIFTKFTRPSILLTEGDSMEIIYRLYAR